MPEVSKNDGDALNMLNLALALGKFNSFKTIMSKFGDILREGLKGNFDVPSYVLELDS